MLFDGATGTMVLDTIEQRSLLRVGVPDIVNIRYPDIIERIAALYTETGAQVLRTNTFSTAAICMRGDISRDEAMHLAATAVSLARKGAETAGADNPVICGTIGDVTLSSETDTETIRDIYADQIHVFSEEGCTMLSFETIMDPAHIDLISGLIPDYMALSVTTCLTQQDILESIVTKIANPNVFVGINCVFADNLNFDTLSHLPSCKSLFPSSRQNPREFAEKVTSLVDELPPGNLLLGGCCGTTPLHIKELSNLISTYNN